MIKNIFRFDPNFVQLSQKYPHYVVNLETCNHSNSNVCLFFVFLEEVPLLITMCNLHM